MDPGERVEESTMETPAETYERLADDTWKAVRYLKQCKFRVLACLVVEQSLRDNAPVKSSAKLVRESIRAQFQAVGMEQAYDSMEAEAIWALQLSPEEAHAAIQRRREEEDATKAMRDALYRPSEA